MRLIGIFAWPVLMLSLVAASAGEGRTIGLTENEQRRIRAAEKEILDGLPGTLKRLGYVAPEKAITALKALVADPKLGDEVKFRVLHLVSKYRVNGTAAHLLPWLEVDPDRSSRPMAALMALHAEEVAEHADKVRSFLECAAVGYQMTAAMRLAEIGDKKGQAHMVGLLRDPDAHRLRLPPHLDSRHRTLGAELAAAFGSAKTARGEYFMALSALRAGEAKAVERMIELVLLSPKPPPGVKKMPREMRNAKVEARTIEKLAARFGKYRDHNLEAAAAEVVARAGDRRGFERLVELAGTYHVHVKEVLCEISGRQRLQAMVARQDLEKWMRDVGGKLTDGQLLRNTQMIPAEGKVKQALLAAAMKALADREGESWLEGVKEPGIPTFTTESVGSGFSVPGVTIRVAPARHLFLIGKSPTFVRARVKRDGTMARVGFYGSLAGIYYVWLEPAKTRGELEAGKWKVCEVDHWPGG